MSRMSTGSALCRLPLFALPAVLALTLLLPAPIPAADTAAPAPDAAQAAESGPSPEERAAEAVLGEVQSALDSKDYKKAVTLLTPLTKNGNAEALYILGRLRAVTLFRQAADKGLANAQNALATALATGDGVRRNYGEAGRWFRKAAEQGLAMAQYNLGYLYAHGRGVRKSENEAIDWYGRAANQGLADAQYSLGWMYLNAKASNQDDTKAAHWFQRAAEQDEATRVVHAQPVGAPPRDVAGFCDKPAAQRQQKKEPHQPGADNIADGAVNHASGQKQRCDMAAAVI